IGEIHNPSVGVYMATEWREKPVEESIKLIQEAVAAYDLNALKIKIGGLMFMTTDMNAVGPPGRTERMIPLVRKTFGDNFAIYADANGSYDVPMAVKIGRLMEEHKLGFLEEPVPFDYYEETKKIADTLTIPIALGEEEMSLRQFRWIIERDVAQVIQPDLLYFGGLIRSMKVARMAAVAGKDCTPHMSGGGLGYLYIAHFASVVQNCGAHQEYKGEEDTLPVSSDSSSLKSEKGMLKVPTGPGLGVAIDQAFIAKSTVVTA
ncbi:MAG TPA: enolase C-terminal domain-like protein, partial [Blastocatellia bacterium]|nr:enolase C-terminal domain-like protein [Blastocatellia bacterium]